MDAGPGHILSIRVCIHKVYIPKCSSICHSWEGFDPTRQFWCVLGHFRSIFTVAITTSLHSPALPCYLQKGLKWLPYIKIIPEMPHFVLLYQDANYLFLVSQVLAMCLLAEGQQLYLHWSHKVGRGFSGNPNHALNNQPVLFPCMQNSLGHRREGRG